MLGLQESNRKWGLALLLLLLLQAHQTAQAKNLVAPPNAGSRPASLQPPPTLLRQPSVITSPSTTLNQVQRTGVSGSSIRAPVRLAAGASMINGGRRAPGSQQLVGLCQLPSSSEFNGPSRCLDAAELNRSALVEFQARLVDSVQEPGHLLRAYRDEFRALALDLIWVARRNTVARLTAAAATSELPPANRQYSYEWAVKRLFDTLYLHVNGSASGNQLERDISAFFRRLQLVQVKRLLEASGSQVVDLECLEGNLQSDKQVEQTLIELSNANEWLARSADLATERARISNRLRQSLEFASTLLNSLNAALDLFHTLASQPVDWLTRGPSCPAALARMSVCQQCAPQQQQQQQHQQVPPTDTCDNFCLNVLRGCMNDAYELNSFWAQHVLALQGFKANMIQTNNLENVLWGLEERLAAYLERLHELQAAPSAQLLADSPYTLSAKMGRQCASRQRSAGAAPPGATRVLPPTQQRHQHHQHQQQQVAALFNPGSGQPTPGYLAERARLEPAHSLFNRLDSFVHELAGSRDFFAQWPERLCRRSRLARSQRGGGGDTLCWNGRDLSGYTKPLVEFGKPLTGSHPEVPLTEPAPVSPLVLNLVARLKQVGAQLARKSVRAPSLDEAPLPAALDIGGAPVSAALARHPLAAGGAASDQAAAASVGDHLQVSGSGMLSAAAAAAVAAAAHNQEPAASQDEEASALLPVLVNDDKQQPDGGDQAGVGGGELGRNVDSAAAAAAEETPEDGDELEEAEEPEEETDETETPCSTGDCSDLLANVTLVGTVDQQPGSPVGQGDAAATELLLLANNNSDSNQDQSSSSPPALYVIPNRPLSGDRLNPVYPYPVLPPSVSTATTSNSPNHHHNNHPTHHNHHSHHQQAPHLNPASTASAQNTLVINLLLALALAILLASLVCLRRLKLRL